MNKLSRKRLMARLFEAYLNWREASLRVSDAYASWANGPCAGATSEFGRYIAALDQEERAAEVYAGLLQRAGAATRE